MLCGFYFGVFVVSFEVLKCFSCLIEIKSGFHFAFLKHIEQVNFLFEFLRGMTPGRRVPRIQTWSCQDIPVVFHGADQCVHEILVVACAFRG